MLDAGVSQEAAKEYGIMFAQLANEYLEQGVSPETSYEMFKAIIARSKKGVAPKALNELVEGATDLTQDYASVKDDNFQEKGKAISQNIKTYLQNKWTELVTTGQTTGNTDIKKH
ncbi:MAG: hypothetical protein LBC07_01705 [Elusimicrobiota bacterium]|nr:hypothetical protein [Elusimicrobiota bacterium]